MRSKALPEISSFILIIRIFLRILEKFLDCPNTIFLPSCGKVYDFKITKNHNHPLHNWKK